MAARYREELDGLKHELNAKVEENFKLQMEVNKLRLAVLRVTSPQQTVTTPGVVGFGDSWKIHKNLTVSAKRK